MDSEGTIAIIEDDVAIRDLVADVLRANGFMVEGYGDSAAFFRQADVPSLDCLILDLMLPGESGLSICQTLRVKVPQLPILMVTAKGDDIDRIIGLEMGADDYVQKPCTPRELVARIRAVLRRFQTRESADDIPAQIRVGPLTLWPARRAAQWGEAPLTLTSTEFNLLQVLARNAGKAVSKPDLSEQAMGRPLSRFDRSIDVHMSSIRHKLGLREDGRTWIQTVRGIGYQLTRE